MTKAVRIHATGGVDQLVFEDVEVPLPGPGEARLAHRAIGLNFIDTYHRTGLYKLPALPAVIGVEAAGIVTSVGPGVEDIREGDRVAYICYPAGAYAEERIVPADRLVPLPDWVSFEEGAAGINRGLTAQYLLNRTIEVKAGDPILVHAAAGGVGLMLCQWAHHIGATVIGTVGSEEKAALAAAHGCDHPIIYTKENFVERVRAITNGEGVRVVYDSIGKDTYAGSIDSLRPLGMMVNYGNASGLVEYVNARELTLKGSLFFTHPSIFVYMRKRQDLLKSADHFFELVKAGAVRINVNQRYALADAARAHLDLEGRKTTGSSILIP
jgi:NADPH:quinone reductase-like Zn-dependent oxidoreductase